MTLEIPGTLDAGVSRAVAAALSATVLPGGLAGILRIVVDEGMPAGMAELRSGDLPGIRFFTRGVNRRDRPGQFITDR